MRNHVRVRGKHAAYPYLPGGAVQSLAFSGRRAFGSPTGAILLSPCAAAAALLLVEDFGDHRVVIVDG